MKRMNMTPATGNARFSFGFSLIEVLVALVVLSIGMLGIAALFINSLQSGNSAILRTRAVAYAEDMADRIRANSSAGADYVVALAGTGANNGCTDTATVDATACTSTQLAQHDVFTWKQMLTNAQIGLPGGQGAIARDTTTAPPTYTVTVQWSEQGGNIFSYVLTFQTS